jgi:hypothetical protein
LKKTQQPESDRTNWQEDDHHRDHFRSAECYVTPAATAIAIRVLIARNMVLSVFLILAACVYPILNISNEPPPDNLNPGPLVLDDHKVLLFVKPTNGNCFGVGMRLPISVQRGAEGVRNRHELRTPEELYFEVCSRFNVRL